MSNRSLYNIFDNYQKCRLSFAQSVADMALRPQNAESMNEMGVLDLLRPLLTDPCPQITNCAMIAVGRLIHDNLKLTESVVEKNFIAILIDLMPTSNRYQKKAILFVLRNICKDSPQLTEIVIKSGGLHVLIDSLEDFEPMVKEAAAWGIGYMARHNRNLAQNCIDSGCLPLLMLCLQEPDLTLKQVATSAIADICKQGEDLAQSVVDTGIVPYLVKNLENTDEKLKKQSLNALSACAKHSKDLAEVVVEAEIFPTVLLLFSHPCPTVRRNAACLVRDVAKHSVELTQLVVNNGAVGVLMDAIYRDDGTGVLDESTVSYVTALGFIAGQSSQLAMTVLGCKAVVVLVHFLQDFHDNDLLAVTAWTLGQIGQHTPEHSNAVAAAHAFPRMVELYIDDTSSEDLKYKCKTALKQCLQKCLLVSALEELLYDAPSDILKYILGQYSKILPNDPKARRLFVTSGGLKKVQEIEAQPGTTLLEYINVINACFPEELVRFYTPGYPESLLEKVEQYNPQFSTVLRETDITEAQMQTGDENVDILSPTTEELL